MKNIIIISMLVIASFTSNAQPIAYRAKFIMPDLSTQTVILMADESEMPYFIKMIKTNSGNTSRLNFNVKNLSTGTYIQNENINFMNVNQAYRIIGNELQDFKDSKSKSLSKDKNSCLFVDDGGKYDVDVFYSKKLEIWVISLTSYDKVGPLRKDVNYIYL